MDESLKKEDRKCSLKQSTTISSLFIVLFEIELSCNPCQKGKPNTSLPTDSDIESFSRL